MMFICVQCSNYAETTSGLNSDGLCEKCQFRNSLKYPKITQKDLSIEVCSKCNDYRQLIDNLFDAIAHGDSRHKAWLKEAIEDHFAGRKVKRP